MKTCALVGSVEFNATHFMSQRFDLVIAVDGGYAHMQALRVTPDVVLGDFDSLGYVPKHPQVLRFSPHKDESDIELALVHAASEGFDRLLVYGCLGERFDFTYAVYQLVVRFTEAGKQLFVIGKDTVVTALSGMHYRELFFNDQAKGTLSLFAASEEIKGVEECGFEYSLKNATLHYNQPLGVSNAFCGQKAKLSISEGSALVFFPVSCWPSLVIHDL